MARSINLSNVEEYIAECVKKAVERKDTKDDTEMCLVADVFRLEELALVMVSRMKYIREQLVNAEAEGKE